MTRWRAPALGLTGLFGLLVLGCATPAGPPAAPPAAAAAPEAAPVAAAKRPDFAVWPHDVSDLAPDPAIRFGVLPNGMRYAIQRGTQPAGIVALRMRLASGSLQETDDQQGLAHFLEHMAFNGSENVPEGEMIKILEREGLAFGPDTNAYTSFGETVYMLDVPSATDARLDIGFKLMRETAGRLLLEQTAIDAEKGVVLSEERARDTPESRITEDRYRFWLKGQRAPDRFPIGTVEDINAATRERLKTYYDSYYRPERAFFVVTGDMDVDAIEARIKATFSDWTARGADLGDPKLGAVAKRGLEAAHRVEPKGPTNVSISWISPPEDRTQTVAATRTIFERSLASAVVNRRLERLARAAEPPFISAGIGRFDMVESATLANLTVSARPGQWAKAMAAAEQELRRALEHGLQPAEVARELAEFRAGLETVAAGAETRDSRGLARGLVGDFNGRAVSTHPKDDLALYAKLAPDMSAEVITQRLRADFAGMGPLIFLASSTPVEGGDAAILAAFEASRAKPVAAPEAVAEKPWPYADFGKPGAVAERREIAELGVTLVRFANGVRLTVKPTDFKKDEVRVSARFPGGSLALPRDKVGVSWAVPYAFSQGALGQLTIEELERALTGKVVGVGLGIGDDSVTLGGAARPADLALQLQLMAANVIDPAYRGEGLARIQAAHENRIKQLTSSPSRLLFRDLNAIVRSGDARVRFPTLAEANAITMADVRAFAGAAFQGPVEITMVGDVTVEAAIAATAATFGALAPRGPAPKIAPAARVARFPKGQVQTITLTHEGRADQAMALVAYRGRDFWTDPKKATAEELMREMLSLRLTDEVREKQGAAYSPGAFEEQSEAYPGFGYVAAYTETPPDKIAQFYGTVDAIAAELRDGKFDDDLLVRARKPLLEQFETRRRTNGYWAAVLADLQSEPRRLGQITSRRARLEGVTREDVIAVARETLQPMNAIRIRAMPKAP